MRGSARPWGVRPRNLSNPPRTRAGNPEHGVLPAGTYECLEAEVACNRTIGLARLGEHLRRTQVDVGRRRPAVVHEDGAYPGRIPSFNIAVGVAVPVFSGEGYEVIWIFA